MPKAVVSLDEIMSKRAFSVRKTAKGAEVLTKIYKSPPSWKPEARSARFVMTAQIEDRYGDIVVSKGGDLTAFKENPVALWAHNSRGFPCGLWDNITVVNGSPKRMEGDCNFLPEGKNEEADIVANLVEAGAVRANSIGFMPLAWESIKDEKDRTTGYQFNAWELLECSPCSVPANPAAIVKAAGGDAGLAMQAIELVLDEWAMTPEGIIVPREKFIAAYNFVRNKEVSIHEVRAIEDDPAPEVEVNPIDIEAAVQRGIVKALSGEGIGAAIKKFLGIKDAAVETPAAPVVEDKTAEPVAETEAQPAAVETKVEPELADEQEVLALRARAIALAA